MGTRSGVVRIKTLNPTDLEEKHVSREIKNLTTSITSMAANHTGELIGFASNESQNSIRLVSLSIDLLSEYNSLLRFVTSSSSIMTFFKEILKCPASF
jgi:hypothetical protein